MGVPIRLIAYLTRFSEKAREKTTLSSWQTSGAFSGWVASGSFTRSFP